MVLNDLYRCGVCAGTSFSVVPLLPIHKVLIEKLYDLLKIYISPYIFPKFACRACLEKIETFDHLIAKLVRGQEHFYAFEEKMLHDLENNSKKDTAETHSLNCQCGICSEKCGLQLLAEVIEQKESEESKNFPTNPVYPQPCSTPEPKPSTSRPTSLTRTKQLKCSYCSKVFSHKGDMNKHLRTHTGEQPFACHICGRKFKHTSNLKRHLTVHSGDKPFTCDMCGKRFNRKDKMESHRKTRLCRKHSLQQEQISEGVS